jgi:hypothetical protein
VLWVEYATRSTLKLKGLTLNYDTVTDLGIELNMQVERAAQVTHGELPVTVNLTKLFLNSKCVMCHCPIQLDPQIVLNTGFFKLCHESVLQHFQVHVLITRTIKAVRSEQMKTTNLRSVNTPQPEVNNLQKKASINRIQHVVNL